MLFHIFIKNLFFADTLALNNALFCERWGLNLQTNILSRRNRRVNQLLLLFLSRLWFDFTKYYEAQYCNLQQGLQIAAKPSFQQVAESWRDVYQLQRPDVFYCAWYQTEHVYQRCRPWSSICSCTTPIIEFMNHERDTPISFARP